MQFWISYLRSAQVFIGATGVELASPAGQTTFKLPLCHCMITDRARSFSPGVALDVFENFTPKPCGVPPSLMLVLIAEAMIPFDVKVVFLNTRARGNTSVTNVYAPPIPSPQ
jgi:hypothetical protein